MESLFFLKGKRPSSPQTSYDMLLFFHLQTSTVIYFVSLHTHRIFATVVTLFPHNLTHGRWSSLPKHMTWFIHINLALPRERSLAEEETVIRRCVRMRGGNSEQNSSVTSCLCYSEQYQYSVILKGYHSEQKGTTSKSIYQYHAAYILITLYIKWRNEQPVDNTHTAAKPYERIVT